MNRLQRLFLGGAALAATACGYEYPIGPSAPTRVPTSVALSLADSALEVGQFSGATASLLDQFGEPFAVAPVIFTSSTFDVAGINPTDGRILAASQGTTIITASALGKTAARVLTVSFPAIIINEVVLHSATGAGWLELYNPTTKAVDLTGWTLTNTDHFRSADVPAGSIIPARGFLVLDEASFPNGLPEREAAHLYSRFGVHADGFAWGHDPVTSYGRCLGSESGLTVTAAQTKGAANVCAL